MKVLIETTLDGNRDVNGGELWRTLVERWRTIDRYRVYSANVGERWRTMMDRKLRS